MALSKALLIQRVRTRLNDNPFQDTCTEAMDTTEVGLDVADTTKYDVGDVVEFQDDGERALVTALASATTLTVIRNFDGYAGVAVGTGTSHSISAAIVKNAVFSYHMVEDAISETIESYYPHVYKEKTYSITPVAGTKWYELDDNADNTCTALEISSVVQDVDSKPFWYGTRRTAYPVEIYFNVPTTIAGSGVAVNIPYLRSTTNAISVNCIAKLTDTVATSNYSDLSDDISGHTTMLFAIAKLIAMTGISRVTQEDVSMSDESVRPLTREQVAADWERKAILSRRRWEQELRQTLPRKGRRAGDGRA